MAVQRGAAPSGLTGLFDFPHLGVSGVNFVLDIILWKVQQEGQTRPRMGRGSTGFIAAMRYVSTGGGGVATGPERGDGWPVPTDWQGAEGTIRIDFNKTRGQYATYPIKVVSFSHLYDSHRDDEPKVTLGFVITALPTFVGWPGTQPTATAISKTDQQQWNETSWTIDASSLASSGQVTIDWWDTGVANTDAAEITKLNAIVAAFSPPSPYKKRPASITRNSIEGGTIVIPLGLTTTEDDVEMPGTVTVTDQSGNIVGGMARVTVVESDGTPDGGVTVAGLVLYDIEKKQLNDGKWAITYIFAQSTREDEIELNGTEYVDDPSDLTSAAIVTLLNNSITPPASLAASPPTVGGVALVLRKITTKKLNTTAATYAHTATYGLTTMAQDIELDATIGQSNPLTIYESQIATVVAHSGTAQALADTLLVANQGDLAFVEAVTRKFTPDKARQILKFTGEDKSWRWVNNHVLLDNFRGVATGGFGSPNADLLIMVPGPPTAGSYTSGYCMPVFQWRALGKFIIRRRFIVTDPSTKMHLAIRGQVNSDWFMGVAPHEVMYEGPSLVYNLDLGGAHLLALDYEFKTDNYMFVNDGYLPIGQAYVNNIISFSLPSSGYYSAQYFDAGNGVAWPAETAFAGFLT